MNKFCIIYNPEKENALEVVEKIKSYLKINKKECFIYENNFKGKNNNFKYTDPEKVPNETECIIVIGGDGTFIHAARDLLLKNIPMIGINLGTVGYLTEIEIFDIEDSLRKLINNDFNIEKRMIIEGAVYKNNKNIFKEVAVNEICLTRSSNLEIINFDVFVNNQHLNSYSADGIIVATPTGSTGYNMSAGEPIVEPSYDLLLLTPICSHSLCSKSIVISSYKNVKLQIPYNKTDCSARTLPAGSIK